METRTWDKLGVKTALLGFGCMRFPITSEGKIDEPLSTKMLEKAYAAGVNYYDTAYMYHNGDSEAFVGNWLNTKDRDNYFLTTNLPVVMINSLEQAKAIFEEQREKLNKEYFDFYLLHALNKHTFKKSVELGIVQYCEDLKAQGKIKHLGFSFHDDYNTFEEILQYRNWDLCQIQLNYTDTEEQAGLRGYTLAEKAGIPIVVMEPVKGGSLANLPETVAGEMTSMHPDWTLSSWAYRWVGSLPNVKVILSGMSTMAQVEDNIKTFQHFKPISSEDQGIIDRAVEKIRARVKNSCTFCRYCMPCPAGVNIPENFAAWNGYGMYENPNDIYFKWGIMISDAEKAKNCVHCGACEKKCPQKIAIRDNLATLQTELDTIYQNR
ncbi:aldo/keto reductase [Aminipila butyrica]|uniref:Aldo/keto reductase n=1 Tax=Aminipila butyrica TaxID=433296 RepID=A0A858BYC3_9FIRM|nr:aldo/keto reductase [Aminipila butyrica]QIB69704.1 aldo/keto reductase [Aminipila butyrica]